MLRFVVRRLVAMVAVMFAISVLVFLIFFATPGVDPARQLAGRNPNPETIALIRHQFDLDRPLPVRYLIMMKKLFISRDLVSYTNQGQKVSPQIFEAMPVTLSLVFGATVIWLGLAGVLGLASAMLKGTIFDPLLMIIALIGISIPVFWLGEVANLVTQSRYHDTFLFSWVPPLGYVSLTSDPIGWFKALLIPWFVLAAVYIGLYARVLRATLLEVQTEDYIRTARAKGLSGRRVLIRHTLRTSLITVISLFGLDFGVLVGGATLLVEVVFGLQGVGYLTYLSLRALDLPVIMATVIYGAFFVVVANAMVDVAYAWLDPRVRLA
jgi:peptide/nickel transport system permease protein